jgi:hypothetical protein
MADFFKGYVALDAEDIPHVFTLEDGAYANKGDLVEYKGELFQICDELFMDKGSAEYRLVMDLVSPKPADAVYVRTWRRNA